MNQDFGKDKAACNFIDKYLESRMKTRVDSGNPSAYYHSPSLQKNQKNLKNLSKGTIENKPKLNFHNDKNELDNLEGSLRQSSSKFPKKEYVELDSPSEEVHDFKGKHCESSVKKIPEQPNVDEANRHENTQNHRELLKEEKYLSDHKYDYPLILENKADSDISEKVARIVELVQPNERSLSDKTPLENSTINYDDSRFSYFALSIMILTVVIGSFLRSTNRLLSTVKGLFDVMILTGWNWTRRSMAPDRVDTDASLFLVILCAPLFGLSVALYIGFRIVYFFNKVLLSRVPKFMAKKVNLKLIKLQK